MPPTPHNIILFELHFDAKFPLYVFYNFDLSDLNSTTYNNNININMVFEFQTRIIILYLKVKMLRRLFWTIFVLFFLKELWKIFYLKRSEKGCLYYKKKFDRWSLCASFYIHTNNPTFTAVRQILDLQELVHYLNQCVCDTKVY